MYHCQKYKYERRGERKEENRIWPHFAIHQVIVPAIKSPIEFIDELKFGKMTSLRIE